MTTDTNTETVNIAPTWTWTLSYLVPALLESNREYGQELLREAGEKLDAIARFYKENPDAPRPTL
jgi:hypothetical protein